MITLTKKSHQLGVLFVLGITWGSSFILMKQGLKAFNGLEIGFMRLTFAMLAMLPFVLNKIKTIATGDWKWLFLTGMLGSAIPAVLFATGISRIDSSLAGIINSTAPLFTLLVGLAFFKLRVGTPGFIGIFTGLAGTIFLILSQKKIQTDPATLYFAFLPLLGSVCYGFSTNIIKGRLQHLSAVTITGVSLLFGGIPAFFWIFLSGLSKKIVSDQVHLQAAGWVVLLGVVGTSLAVVVFNFLIRHTSVLFAASVTYLIPFFALIWGWISGESITIYTFLGMGIILLGVGIVNRDR